MDAVIARSAASAGRPAITYRHAGDQFVVAEYGEMELDLRLNFYAIAVKTLLDSSKSPAITESAPGYRSLMVGFDSKILSPEKAVDLLESIHNDVAIDDDLVIPSRRVVLPIAFDDTKSAEAVARYTKTIRADAPNCKDGTNIDYVVEYNGLSSRDELYRTITGTQWWNAFTGFFPGLPFMFPIDPRMEITVPKYNPTRTWTAEGAVGIGGPCVAIYPVESPGGYQLFGRTLPILDMQARNKAFAEDPLLIRPGDRIRFTVVDEAELDELRRAVFEDRYEYQIAEEPFVVRDYLASLTELADEAATARTHRAQAAAGMEVP
ncbi:MAG: carboxyltransferase domain-containing protein [Nakamurella sp.]